MPSDCIFCKIADGEIPASKVYEDDLVMAFKDINPVAPVHVLVIPKRHLESMNDLHAEDTPLLGALIAAAQRVAREQGVAESGYRLVTNIGKDSGQVVKHLHFHVMGGKTLGAIG
ncbi:MAG: histidine triad nucleotide-binding protein [Mycobacterium leprae]